jgi:hypothetical protein
MEWMVMYIFLPSFVLRYLLTHFQESLEEHGEQRNGGSHNCTVVHGLCDSNANNIFLSAFGKIGIPKQEDSEQQSPFDNLMDGPIFELHHSGLRTLRITSRGAYYLFAILIYLSFLLVDNIYVNTSFFLHKAII